MSEKHLQKGDPLPPLKDGSIRLYSMKFCPFAHRNRLVFHAKGIEYEEINCNLLSKPEFLLERNPEGDSVPTFEHNGEIISDSNVISDLLDEMYPDPPMYPIKDPIQKAKDKNLMDKFSYKTVPVFYQLLRSEGKNEEARPKFAAGLAMLEAELKKRGTPFFSGEQPGMVDYSTWPFIERTMVAEFLYEFVKDKLPLLQAYIDRMSALPVVQAVAISKEVYRQFFKGYVDGNFTFDIN